MAEIKSFDNVRFLVIHFFLYLDLIKYSPELNLFPERITVLGPKQFYFQYINNKLDDIVKITEGTEELNSHMSLVCKLSNEWGYYSLTFPKTDSLECRVNYFNLSNDYASLFQ